MIYYANKKKEIVKKNRINLNKNNQNYIIDLYVYKEKIEISLNYKNENKNELFEYANSYSYYQLQIINKFFRKFNSLEQICTELDKLLKNKEVIIEEKFDFIILSIATIYQKERINIVFKLLKNKLANSLQKNNLRNFSVKYNTNLSRKSLSMPKYNKNYSRQIRSINNDLNDNALDIESNGKYNNNNIKNDNNINNMIKRINKLEKLNSEKDTKIKELADHISKCEGTINNIINSQILSKSHISKQENKKNSNSNIDELELNIYANNNNNKFNNKSSFFNDKISKNKKDKTINSIDNKNKKNQKYYFRPIKNEQNNNSSIKDENNNKIYNKNLKNKSKSQHNKKGSNSQSLRNEEENEQYNSKSNSSDSRNEESNKNSSYINKNKKYKYEKNEEEKGNESENNKKEQINENENENNENKNTKLEEEQRMKEEEEDLKNKKKITGLPMPKREDLKEYVNSRIFFTKKELQMVKNKITENKKNCHVYFEVLYRASIDGDYEEQIDYLCEGIYPQLILFYTQDGARFGVYIEKEKYTDIFGFVKYREIPGTSFLISLNLLKTYNILKDGKATGDRPEKLCFGRTFYYNNNESNWLIYTPRNEFLDVKCMIGDKLSNFGVINPNEIVGNKIYYYLKEVEIFKVIIYTDEDLDDNKE